MSQTITDLKKTLGSLKKQTEELSSTVTTIRDRIMLLEAEQATILERPLSKADMLELFLARVDSTAEVGDARWVGVFKKLATERFLGNRQRRVSVNNLRHMQRGKVNTLDDSFLTFDTVMPREDRPLTAESVFSLFREPIKEAIRRHFEQITDWPFPDAEPASTYFMRLDEIEAELKDLHEQEALLVKEAKELGVTLPEPYQP